MAALRSRAAPHGSPRLPRCQADALLLAERLMRLVARVCRTLRSGIQRIRGLLCSVLGFLLRPTHSQAQHTLLPTQRFDFAAPNLAALVASVSLRGVCRPLPHQQPRRSPQRAAASPFVGPQHLLEVRRLDGSRRHAQVVAPCARALRLLRSLPAQSVDSMPVQNTACACAPTPFLLALRPDLPL